MPITKAPHVVMIMADQLRKDAINEQVTPNIAALRRESVEFDRVYCASPLCVPARGAFFTGTWPNVNGSIINPGRTIDRTHGVMRDGIRNLYELMEQRWDSRHVGKQHLLTEPRQERRSDSPTRWATMESYNDFLKQHGKRKPGGDKFRGITPEMAEGRHTRMKTYSSPATGCYEEGFDFHTDGFFANHCVEALRSRDMDKPFLLNAMFLAPHPPFDVPEPWFSHVQEAQLPENVGKWCPNQSPLQLYNLTGAIGTKYSREDWQRIWPVYLGLVSMLDHGIGMIVEELKRQGIYDDTLILFTSDHGEMLGSHCLWQKNCMYEESVHVPLYLKFPKGFEPAVRRSDELVSAIDVMPTLCDYLGLEQPQGVNGLSLMPVIQGGTLDRERIFIQFDGNQALGNFQRCVVEGRYKLIADMFKDELYLELYDVLSDPQEQDNLAFEQEHEARIRGMLEELIRHMTSTGDRLTLPADAYDQFFTARLAYKNS